MLNVKPSIGSLGRVARQACTTRPRAWDKITSRGLAISSSAQHFALRCRNRFGFYVCTFAFLINTGVRLFGKANTGPALTASYHCSNEPCCESKMLAAHLDVWFGNSLTDQVAYRSPHARQIRLIFAPCVLVRPQTEARTQPRIWFSAEH